MSIRFLTAGESHGRGLVTIIEGLPAGIPIDNDYLQHHLRRRQLGYGRGLRMKMEGDYAEIISGVRFGKTTGNPVSMVIWNKDWENWSERLSVFDTPNGIEKVSIPRPGHADLVGTIKNSSNDIRNSIERSSARETAARVAACTIIRKMLEELSVDIGSFVECIGGIKSAKNTHKEILENPGIDLLKISGMADKSEVRVINKAHEKKIISAIKKIKKDGDTLGGTFVVFAVGVPVGIGSFSQFDTRLDAAISSDIMSIQAVKGVEIGMGFDAASKPGSIVHDEITFDDGVPGRRTNRAGGIEGGISTGLPIIVRAAMKPIATLMSPLKSIDLNNFHLVEARRERSDFTAVPACAVIAESMLAYTLGRFITEKFGGNNIEEMKENLSNFQIKILTRLTENFSGKLHAK